MKAVKINNCNPLSLYSLGNNVIYTINNTTYINNEVFRDNISIKNFSVFNNEMFFFIDSKLYKFDNNEIKELFYIKDADAIRIVSDNILLYHNRISRKELKYSFLDFNYNLLWTQTKNEFITTFGNFSKLKERLSNNKFKIVETKTGKNIWYFTLPEGFTIFGKIQVVDDVLFFTSYKDNDREELHYGINIYTGKIMWKKHFNVLDFQLVATQIYKNLVYGYAGKFYQILNPKDGEILFKKDMSQYVKAGIEPTSYKNTLSENILWFVSGRGENAKFGALNIKTHEIEFVQDYPLGKDGQFDKPIYHKGKLYLRDSNNVLHIFEKEK